MNHKNYNLRLTRLAEQDLNDLYCEGFSSWGEQQADRYYDGLLERFEQICAKTMMYPAVDEIMPGYRRSVYERHSIYFVIKAEHVEIRAVVKHQDVQQRL